MQHEMKTVQEVEQFAAAHGVILTPADRSKVSAVQRSELERLQALSPEQQRGWSDKWNEFYPTLLASIAGFGETLLTMAQTIIVSIGVPVVLVLLLIVEHQRIQHGIQLFELNESLAWFGAMALVMLNLTLEFTVHHVEHSKGYEAHTARRWSLRIWSKNMAYRLGIGDDWQAVELSPAERYRSLLRLVTFTILALALAGSMRNVIDQQAGTWYEALADIVTSSSLADMTVWLGGLLFAAAAVLSAQGLSRYVAIRVVEISATMKARQAVSINPHAADIDAAGARAALALVNQAIEKKRAKLEVKPVNPTQAMEVPSPLYAENHPYTNGKHSETG